MNLSKLQLGSFALGLCFAFQASAQQTNPVERRVSNPITDVQNSNPLSRDTASTPSRRPKSDQFVQEGGDGELVVYSDTQSAEGEVGKRIVVHSGNVDVRYGIYRLQADKITVYEADARIIAEGSVVFDQGEDQRITGERGEWNYRTKLGKFINSTGFTNQTVDGSVIFFTADSVERIALDEFVVTNGKFTACEEAVPKWSFTASEARVKNFDRVRLKNARFRVLDRAVLPLPYVSIPIDRRDRASGFLTPTFGYSGTKGARLSGAYYKTLGNSMDVTLRGDLYTARGIGFGFDARTRANSRSFFNFGFYAVKDRILGPRADSTHPDQGGSLVFADGVQYFRNGFVASVDVRLTSNLAFRQVFSDGIQQIISPIEISQGFITKSWNNYSLNLLSRAQVISIPNVRVKTRNLPSIHFEKRPSEISFLKKVYFSFQSAMEGVSRREEVDDTNLYRLRTGSDPVVSPAVGQRLDFFPRIDIPLHSRIADLTVSLGGRVTYYSDSFNDMRRVVGKDVMRRYGELTLDLRPTALARNFYGATGRFRFRHSIEPFVIYRRVAGIDNFRNIIRFDAMDTVSDTNEVEFGVSNRFYTRRYSEAVTPEAQRRLQQDAGAGANPLSIQPYEVFTITVRGKYFFDRNFGGALVPGARNQLSHMTGLTFYSFGGAPRRYSPINIDATYRPSSAVFVNSRVDIGTQGDGIRAASASIGFERRLLKIFQTFYYTRAVTLVPALAAYAAPNGKESGTLRGSQWNPSVFLGNRERGPFGGVSLFFDFQNRRGTQSTPLVSSLYTAGYAYNCCALVLQYYTFNVGVRKENRYLFSFKLNGIGSFGTEQFAQGLR